MAKARFVKEEATNAFKKGYEASKRSSETQKRKDEKRNLR